ncbi:MAG: tetratricopeptide repeat protein [Planctomycetaceae bacterium]|nr:tetratricopeptide repeat protein [Planctomycetaceae bacterium]
MLFFLHDLQVTRNAGVLRDNAHAALEEGDNAKAISLLAQYVKLVPDDTDAMVQLGELMDQSAPSVRNWRTVSGIYAKILRESPGRSDAPELRYRLVQLLLKLNEFEQVQVHLDKLHAVLDKTAPQERADWEWDRAELFYLTAQSEAALDHPEEALTGYIAALSQDPTRVEFYERAIGTAETLGDDIPSEKAIRTQLEAPPYDCCSIADEWLTSLPQPLNSSEKTEVSDEKDGEIRELDEQTIDSLIYGQNLLKSRAYPLVQFLLDKMPNEVIPKYDAYLSRARYHLSHGDLERVETELQQIAETDQSNSDVVMFRSQFAFQKANNLYQSGKIPQALAAIQEAEEQALLGDEANPTDLRYDLLLANAKSYQSGFLTNPEERESTILKAREYLENAIDELPAVREDHLTMTDLEERDRKLGVLNVLEIELRTELAQVLLSIIETEIFSSKLAQEASQQLDTLREELATLIRDDGLLDYLEAHHHFASLVRRSNPAMISTEANTNNLTWGDVVEELQSAKRQLFERQALRRKTDLLLARCYEQLNHTESRLALFRTAFETDPTWIPGRLGLAGALAENGQIQEAYQHYYELSKQFGISSAAAEIARLQIRVERAKPESERDWSVPNDLVAKLLKEDPQNPDYQLLAVELQSQQGQFDEAANTLHAALELPNLNRDEKSNLWQSLIRLQLLRRDQDTAQKVSRAQTILSEARQELGDSGDLALSELLIFQRKSDEELDEQAQRLRLNLGKYPADEQITILENLTSIYTQLDQDQKKYDTWKLLAEKQPDHLPYQLALCQESLAQDLEDEFQLALDNIRRIEGTGGPWGNFHLATWHVRQLEKSSTEKKNSLDPSHIEQAKSLLDQLNEQRPRWDRVSLLRGYLAELLGDIPGQIRYYSQAIDQGARNPRIYQIVLGNLFEEGRLREAQRLAERIRRQDPQNFTTSMARNLAAVYFRRNQEQDAFSVIRESVKKSPEFQQRLTEGLLTLIEYETEEIENPASDKLDDFLDTAEQNFQQAAQLAPHEARVWTSFVTFYLKIGKPDNATQVIEQAVRELPATPPLLKPVTLAICYELVGDYEQATAAYDRALSAEPENLALQIRVAEFFRRIKDTNRERLHLEKVQKLAQGKAPGIVDQAQSRLTYLATLSGTYSSALQSVRQLEHSLPEDESGRLRNLLARASILSRYNAYDFRVELLRVLEQINEIQPLSLADRFRLITLQEFVGDSRLAEEGVKELVAEAPQKQLIHNFAATFYIDRAQKLADNNADQGEIQQAADRATSHIEHLEQRLTDSIVTISLRARHQQAVNQQQEAIQLIQNYADNLSESTPARTIFEDTIARREFDRAFRWVLEVDGINNRINQNRIQQADRQLSNENFDAAFETIKPLLDSPAVQKKIYATRLRECSEHLDRFGELAAAESTYDRYMQVTDDEQAFVVLISLYGRQGKVEQALQLAEQKIKPTNASSTLQNLIALVRTGKLTAEQQQRVQTMLDTVLEQDPANPKLLRRLADLQDYREEYDAAEITYLQVISQSPNNFISLNNLAWLFAMRNQSEIRTQKAREWIDQAIELLGPNSELLDTKATVELAANNHTAAIALLEKAIKASPSATKYLHLARAQMQAGRKQEARESFERALTEGLDFANLHPLEQSQTQKLRESLLAIR